MDLLALLERLEWSCADMHDDPCCPECGHTELEGHRAGCELDEAIHTELKGT